MWFADMVVFLLVAMCMMMVAAQNPLESVITHAHLRGGKLFPCPQNACEMDTTTKLYFWIREGTQPPNMFLRTRSSGGTIHVTTNLVPLHQKLPPFTKSLQTELFAKSGGDVLRVVEAEFPNNEMTDTTYTFLLTANFRSWIAVDMICERFKRPFERFRRGQRLVCYLDKRDWEPMRLPESA